MTSSRLPAVDDRLVDPEQNIEMIDGEVLPVVPAREPHGDRHSKLSSLLEASVAEGYNVAIDMLTRTNETSDVAPDASIYPRARDPETGGRQLEHLAFEVVSQQTLRHVARRARSLADRGVRKIFAIDVGRKRVLQWSPETDGWEELAADGTIEDEVLAVPLSIRELATCVSTMDAVARVLLARDNEVLAQALAEREERGERRTTQRNIVSVLVSRGLEVTEADRSLIEATTDVTVLERWLTSAATCKSTGDLFDPG